MSEQVGRKKSYRWVSASQASYDGADWDSSDNYSDDDENVTANTVTRKGTISKLPKLPKLEYVDQDKQNVEQLPHQSYEQEEIEHDEQGESTHIPNENEKQEASEASGNQINSNQKNESGNDGTAEKASSSDSNYLSATRPSAQLSPVDSSRGSFELSSLARASSLNSSKSSSQNRRTPVNEGLENLMAEISKEMSPKVTQGKFFGTEIQENNQGSIDREWAGDNESITEAIKHENDQNGIGIPSRDDNNSGLKDAEIDSASENSDNEEYKVSKGGYFSNLIHSEEEQSTDEESTDEKNSVELQEQKVSEQKEIDKNSGELVEEVGSLVEEIKDDERAPHEKSLSEPEGSLEVQEPLKETENSLASKNEEYHDRHSSSLSISEDKVSTSLVENESDSRNENATSEDYSSDEMDDGLSYTDSIKYQGRAEETESDDEPTSTFGVENDQTSKKEHSDSSIESHEDFSGHGTDEDIMHVSRSGYFKKMIDEDDEDDIVNEKGTQLKEENNKLNRQDTQENSEDCFTEGDSKHNQSSTESLNEKDEVQIVQETSDEAEKESNMVDSRQSVNLGKWRPDTEAFRAGFVEDTSKKAAPPGYVYDENGKLVDLTPSSMKPRIVSTYSEVESSWNAFPSEGVTDLETIKDTKTIYDNNTVFNVPGIMSTKSHAPPLPEYVLPMKSSDSQDEPRSIENSVATSTLEGDKGPLQTHFQEVFSVHEPDSKDIAKLSHQNKVPFVDINKILNGKSSHKQKIQQLQEHLDELEKYDTGIQTWLSYSLKSSSKSDKDYLFDEYKVNNHVRDAYAHADELSRKHSVINTVASVNQNMTHLTKKVISHSRKSRGIFSSIGKKKI